MAERGYYLAQGDKRSFVVIDEYGEIYSLPKQLPKGINTKQVRKRLGTPDELPSVDDILFLIKKKRETEPQQNNDDLKTQSLKHLNRYHAAFRFRMANRALKPLIPDKIQRQEIIDELVQSKALIKIGKQNGLDVHATTEMVSLEKSIAENVSQMVKTSSHPSDKSSVHRAIFNLNNKIACETNGKGSLSSQQKEALQAQGYRVLGAAPSGIAASGLKEIGTTASTLHSLEYRIELAQKMMSENEDKPLSPKQAGAKLVLVGDPAQLQIVETGTALLVLVGDPAQLQIVETGTAFKNLLECNHSVSLTEVRRQKTAWQREATIKLSQGHIPETLQAYDQYNCIIKSKTRASAKEQLVADMMQAKIENPDKNRLVLAYTRKDVADLNAMIKAEMVRRGKISNDNISVTVTTKDGDTEKSKKSKIFP